MFSIQVNINSTPQSPEARQHITQIYPIIPRQNDIIEVYNHSYDNTLNGDYLIHRVKIFSKETNVDQDLIDAEVFVTKLRD
ncbi:hypothetical protein [Enterococcus gilvus]|uniref:hypothetical protein n=1 Tax=Enterococcus gilvus TaxID=160453 RepID=UPI0028D4F1C3|nr:hypothetical protein [Enterococcus gilvus]